MATEATNPQVLLQNLAGSRFSFEKLLGSGGMGEVCLARDTHLHRLVAIKTIRKELSTNDLVRKRIERECLMHARVGPHPNIVTLFDKMEIGDVICLVMEYVEGEVLQDRLVTNEMLNRNMPVREAITIAAQCLDALMRIHMHGIVHRDIKPANIMLCWDGSRGLCAKLMDFGISFLNESDTDLSRLTNLSGVGPGTPLYMAPEQIDSRRFGPVTRATDLYATGVLLYEMLTGSPPFTGTFTEIFHGQVNSPLPPLVAKGGVAVIGELNSILQKALAKDPAFRYHSAQEFRDQLLHFLAVLDGQELVIERAQPEPSLARPVAIQDLPTRAAGEKTPYIAPTYLGGRLRGNPMPTFLSAMHGNRGVTVGVILTVLLIPMVTVWVLKSYFIAPQPARSTAAAAVAPAPLPVAPSAPAPMQGTLITSQPPEPPSLVDEPVVEASAVVEASDLVEGPNVVEAAALDVPPTPPPLLAWPLPPAEDTPAVATAEETMALAANMVPDATGLGAAPELPVTEEVTTDPTLETTEIAPPPGMEPTDPALGVVTGESGITAVIVQPNQGSYTVRPGDTLSAIAANHGFTWEDLAAWNGLTSPYALQVGDTLYFNEQPRRFIKPAPPRPAAPQRYVRAAPAPAPKYRAQPELRRGRDLKRIR